MKVCLFGNKTSTAELAIYLVRNGFPVDYLVTLHTDRIQKFDIAGKSDDLVQIAHENKINIHFAHTYSLKDPEDVNFFKQLKFDIGLCTGWQRLIPKEILDTFEHGVYGWHGSGFELPNGRGRSPLNWSIRLGHEKVYHNFFKYVADADAGSIYETKPILIRGSDYIADLQVKARNHILESSVKLLRDLREKKPILLRNQPDYPYIEFPALSQASGEIFPQMQDRLTALRIIKSCSRPFPGAFIVHENKKYRIWTANIESNALNMGNSQVIFLKTGILFMQFSDGLLSTSDFEVLGVD